MPRLVVKLKGGEQVITTVTLTSLNDLGLQVGADAVLLINSADITLTIDSDPNRFSARNRLSCSVIRVQQDEVNAEVIVLLPGGETLVAMITQQSAQSLALMPGMPVWAMFKSNAPVLGVMSSALITVNPSSTTDLELRLLYEFNDVLDFLLSVKCKRSTGLI